MEPGNIRKLLKIEIDALKEKIGLRTGHYKNLQHIYIPADNRELVKISVEWPKKATGGGTDSYA